MTDYCGWPNVQTWIVNLYLSNDGLEESFRDLARELIASNRDSATRDLAVHIQDYFVETMPELNGFWQSMLQSSFAFVCWYKIAESIVDEEIAGAALRGECEFDDDDDDFVWLQ